LITFFAKELEPAAASGSVARNVRRRKAFSSRKSDGLNIKQAALKHCLVICGDMLELEARCKLQLPRRACIADCGTG
jgi:hypothetical protein